MIDGGPRSASVTALRDSKLSFVGRCAFEAFGCDIGQGRILIRQKVSQSDLATMAGIARENVSRVLMTGQTAPS
jgi:CRP-like cAMP-binding protein